MMDNLIVDVPSESSERMMNMDRIRLGTEDGTKENVERIAQLFPEVVTEAADAEGNLEHVIDFDTLRNLLGDVAEGQRERYQFTWPGKAAAKAEARKPIWKTMRPEKDRSVDWDTTRNLYIEGDNLDALKLLKETYAGKVKLIYIDPPYNTGGDFIYDDNYRQTHEDYDGESGDYDEDGGRLVANPDSNGRFHSDWCSMIYPRLLLARDLLSADGVIFISIDDNELKNLSSICNEVFGATNFIGTIVWNKRVPKNDNKGIGNIHEYVLAYSKQQLTFQLTMKKDGLEEIDSFLDGLKKRHVPIPEAEAQLKQFYRDHNYDRGITLYNCLDEQYRPWGKINMSWPNANTFGPRYEILHPKTGKPVKIPDRGWRWKQETFYSQMHSGPQYNRFDGSIVCGSIWCAEDESTQPSSIKYLSDVSRQLLRSILSLKSDGGIEVEHLFDGKSFFSYPKPTSLMRVLLDSIGQRDGIFMDFFSGSSTTADALMQLNKEDDGTRMMISVQLPEVIAENSVAGKAGYQTICDIGEERIRRAGAKIKAEVEEANRQLRLDEEPKPVPDVGFRVLRIDSSNMEDTYRTPGETSQMDLLSLADNVKIDRSAEDLLFEVLPKFRIPYSARIERRELGGKECFLVDGNRLVACFDIEVGTETIEEMAKLEPDYAVMRDASMKDDATQANFEELFKTYSPDTVRRVI